MKTFRSTGLFALFVIGLALASYFIVYRGEQQKNAAKEKASILFPFSDKEVSEVMIESGSKKLHLKKEGDSWKILEPVEYSADADEARIFVTAITGEKSLDQIRDDDQIPWNIFGLDKPSGSVTLTTSGGQTKKVLIGSRKTYNNDLYLRFDGEHKVLLVSSSWSNYLNKDIKSLREKRIFTADTGKVNDIKIRSSKGGKTFFVQLVRDDEKKWKVKNEPKLQLDQSSIKEFLENVKGLRAVDFVAENKDSAVDAKKYELDKTPAVEIELKTGDKDQAVWTLKAAEPSGKEKDKDNSKAFVVTSDLKPILQVARFNIDKLQVEANDFRDKKEAFDFKVSDVRGLKYRSQLFSTELVKEHGVWKEKDPKEGEEVVKDQVEHLIQELNGLRVQKFLGSSHGKGLAPAKVQIELTGKDDEEVFKIKWGDEFKDGEGKDAPTLVYAQTSELKETIGIDANKVRSLPGQTMIKMKATPKEPAPKTATEKPKAAGA